MTTKLSMIVAADENNVIGDGKKMPWHLPDDFKWFRQHTLGKPILMGRKTYESIGRPLPQRRNFILSRQQDLHIDEVEIVASLDEALFLLKDTPELVIIGGGQLYQQFLPLVDTVYLTRVHTKAAGTVTFPKLNESEWQEVEKTYHPRDEKHQYDFTFYELIKK